MTLVRAPLLSASARGRLGRDLYGIKTPAGPAIRANRGHPDARTAAQLAQRDRFLFARDVWTDTNWLLQDVPSWSRYAKALGRTYSAYTALTQTVLRTLAGGGEWTTVTRFAQSAAGTGNLRLRLLDNGEAPTRYSMVAIPLAGGPRLLIPYGSTSAGIFWNFDATGLTPGAQYRCYAIDTTQPGEQRRTGDLVATVGT